MKRRKAIGKAMSKEEYSWRDGFAELIEKKEKEKKITGEGVDNSKLIKVFPDEVKQQMMDKEEKPQMAKPDPQIASKEKKQAMLKKQVLMKKLQAVRAGAGSDITSSYEPEGENVIETDLNYGRKKGMTEAEYEAKAREAANESERRRKQKDNAARVRRSEMGAARRRENRNYLRSIGKYKGRMEGVEIQLDELSTDTLKSYIPKAQKASRTLSSKKEVAKKKQGIDRAVDQVAEKETIGRTVKKPKGFYDRKNYEGQKKQYLVGKETRKGHKDYGKIPRNDAYREDVQMKPEDKTPENAGDITFDAGGAIPATIKAIGDPRELETAMKLKKTQLRASGLNMSHEPEGDTISDAYVVTQSDKTGNTKAYQDMKAGKKNQITGEPLYKKADHMKENLVTIEKFNNVANINVKPSNYTSEKDVINEILAKGTRGEVGFRSGGQVKKDPKSGKEKYVQSMKTDKVTVMNKGTKASGGKKARKRPESPEGKAIGALSKHQSKQWSSERKASAARKAGDKKTAAKHDAAANRAYQRRRGVSGTLFDKTGNFHDRADND